MSSLETGPLLRWDGVHLVLDRRLLEARLQRWIAGVEAVRRIRLEGIGDGLRMLALVEWMGVRGWLRADLVEIRLRHRRLGLRLGRLRVWGGFPVPLVAVDAVLASLPSGLATLVRDERILVVDLRSWLAAELDLSVVTVQATGDAIHIWIAPGRLEDLPAAERPSLPADAAAGGSPSLDRPEQLG